MEYRKQQIPALCCLKVFPDSSIIKQEKMWKCFIKLRLKITGTAKYRCILKTYMKRVAVGFNLFFLCAFPYYISTPCV